jgi:5'-methylthioadenosine phosphorylase
VETVIQNLLKNVATAKEVLRRLIPSIPLERPCGCSRALANAVITNPAAFPLATRRRLELLLGKYFPDTGSRRPGRKTGSPRG